VQPPVEVQVECAGQAPPAWHFTVKFAAPQVAVWHTPPTQVVAQGMPQPPQFIGSVDVLTQLAPHTCSPAGHTQVPVWHDAPTAHAFPQAPQLAFVLGGPHVPPVAAEQQLVPLHGCAASQDGPHALLVHASPVGQSDAELHPQLPLARHTFPAPPVVQSTHAAPGAPHADGPTAAQCCVPSQQ
jgi:hypothetical protein